MNDVQNIIDRQLGIYTRFNYDNVLKRLLVHSDESFYGLQTASSAENFDQDPPIFACRFSEAPGYEHILALANEDGRVAIQDTRSEKTASKLEGFQCHNNAVFDLAWMPQNMKFVTVSGDHTACLWDVSAGAPRRVLLFPGHSRSVKTAAFRPTEPSVFATGARDGRVLLWDARQPAPALQLRPGLCLQGCHAASPRASPRARRAPARRALSITGLAFRDDLTLVSCGECDGNIKLWDMRKNYAVYKREPLPKHSIPYCGSSARNGYTNLIVDDARVRLYASCMDDVIYCFNVSTFTTLPEQRYIGHENSTFYIKTGLSPDGAYLVSGSSDKNAYVWNVKYSQPVVRLGGHRAEVTCAAWCQRGGTKIVTCSDDARHKIWRVGREAPDDAQQWAGRAEPVPRAAGGPHWGARDRTPHSLKRPRAAPASPASPARRASSKRCLAELLGAARDADDDGKRPRLAPAGLAPTGLAAPGSLAPAGLKRRRQASGGSPCKRRCSESERPDDWACGSAKAGTSYVTPTKNYERRDSKAQSPGSPKPLSPDEDSRGAVKIITFTTPTKNLPNFVLNGEAPHLRLMSPVRKKPDTTDWLTLLLRERRGRAGDKAPAAPPSPPAGPPAAPAARRTSTADRLSKTNNKNRTLLKYFSVARKDK